MCGTPKKEASYPRTMFFFFCAMFACALLSMWEVWTLATMTFSRNLQPQTAAMLHVLGLVGFLVIGVILLTAIGVLALLDSY